jgi:hypothetical protein
VQIELGIGGGIDLLEKLDPLLVAMLLHAGFDHQSVGDDR